MKIFNLFSLFMFVLLTQCAAPTPETKPEALAPRTLLAIFAHPDDEETVGPVLAKYAAEGIKVYLVIATDGRLGVNDHAKIPAGDSLAAVRKIELQCAAEKLGINAPIMFGLHDQLKISQGLGEVSNQLDSLRRGVAKLFNELSPDVVITWNASGWTGHMDHRLVGSIVTEVFESRQWAKPANLYYAGIPTGKMPADSPMQLATVDKSFLTVSIAVSDADYAKSKEAWLCHKSQYTPEAIDGMQTMIKQATQNTWYFRPHSGSSKLKQTLF